jgi:hypothetical protein
MPRKSICDYPTNWPEISAHVKDEAGWKCIRCGHPHDVDSGHMLTVHHLDLDKSNCEWWNLLALCQRCHLHIQAKVIIQRPWMFQHSDWFKPYAAGYYAKMNGKPTDRIYVMDNLDELLAYGYGNVNLFISLDHADGPASPPA